MHVLDDDNRMTSNRGPIGDRRVQSNAEAAPLPAQRVPDGTDQKKPAEGAAGEDHFKKWRERKTGSDYRLPPLSSLAFLQLLTNGM